MKHDTSRRLELPSFQFALALLALFFCSTVGHTQDLDNATIGGRVLDQNGAVISGAAVRAMLVKTGAARSTTSDADGRYRFIQLEPGQYIVGVSCSGFASQERPALTTLAGQRIEMDLTLYPFGVNSESVVIISTDPPVIDTSRTVVGETVTSREAESLPIASRSILDLVFTLPGITEEPLSTRDLAEDRNASPATTPEEAGMFALSGAPAYSNNVTIDGLDDNDDRAARERFQPSLEAIEEVQVITNQFSAEYGRASGGRINLRTRSGSKEFAGRVFYFFRDEALNANTFRNNSLGLSRLPLQEHDGGFTFGGPAWIPPFKRSSNTLFFVAYEVDKVLDSALIDTLVPVEQNRAFPLPAPTTLLGRRPEKPSAPALATELGPFISSISTPLRNTAFTARVDEQFTQTHNASIVYQLGRLINLRQFGGGNRLAESLLGKTRNSDAISYSDNYVFSAQLVNQARAQLSRLSPSFQTSGAAKPVVLITLSDSLLVGDPARRSGTLIAGSSSTGASDRREDRVQLQDVLSFVQGRHSLKLGADFQHVRSTFTDLSDTTGTFNFASAGDFLAGVPSRFRQNFQSISTQRNAYVGFFFQDEWQVIPKLLFSFGIRYERETIVHDRNNFGPRLSFAYNPLKSGKLVLRVGGGIFYNRALLRTIDDFTLGIQQLFFDTNSLRDPLTGKLLTADGRRNFIATNIHFPETLESNSPLVSQFGVLNTEFSRRLDPSLRIPESYQANFGAEFDLGRGFSLETNYTLNRGIHLWREFNANAAVLPHGYKNFADYLASRDFANFYSATTGARPLYNAANAGELVRFVFGTANPANLNTVGRIVEFGVPVSLINLYSVSSTTALDVALAALNDLRPDPTRAELEQLISAGNSFYKGVTVELRKRFNPSENRLGISFRAAYTVSSLTDDGILNTSDALFPGDFRSERARSLLDRRHRFVFSGTFDLPSYLGGLHLSPVWRLASGAPFNISIGGTDRNLDDVGNDRPIFQGDTRLIRWRAPGKPIDPALIDQFALPTIGQSGNLPRNAGHGPGLFMLDLNLTREFRINEKLQLRPMIEFDNMLNKTVFSFGSEFINFNAIASTASAEQKQAFLNSFLVATHTLRPRQIRVGLRLEF
jgi:hypothetical protein